jgi:WD repeat-containing protein 53
VLLSVCVVVAGMSSNEALNQHRLKEQQQTVIQSFSLKGHIGPVLCLDHSSNRTSFSTSVGAESTLLSGSEDGTCRLWDLRTGTRANLCIQCGSVDVLSVAFGPKWSDNPLLATLPESSFARDYFVYAAVGTNVLGYDLRNVTSPIISAPSADFSFLEVADEINQIVFSPAMSSSRITSTSARKHHSGRTSKAVVINESPRKTADLFLLATADDSGSVRVAEFVEGGGDIQRMTNPTARVYCHGENALVTAIAFVPCIPRGGKPVLLASGGTDCSIHLWEAGSSHRSNNMRQSPLHSVSIPTTATTESNQMYNPPMVHSLNWSRSGRLLGAGLGDGSIAILQQNASSTSSLVLSARMVDAHAAAVASCFFPDWCSPSGHAENPAIVAHDRLFCSAGNDGCIVVWDLGPTVGGEKANDPAKLFPMLQHDVDEDKATSALRRLQVSNTDDAAMIVDEPQALFCLPHDVKPNWVVSSGSRDTSFPYTLFVADTSHTICAYSIPIQ